uniref:T9SS type A sorting domain-containing protein n=1 Tax=Arenibacter lacus TaxID=2608629 RepID=UPI00123CF8AD
TDGVLDIDFSSLVADGGVRHPIINGIEVLGNSSPAGPQGAAGKGVSTRTSTSAIAETEINPEMNMVSITPNPASWEVAVSLWDKSLEIRDFKIHDVSGRYIGSLQPLESKSMNGIYRFDVSALESGFYILNITTNDGNRFRHKLIIKK